MCTLMEAVTEELTYIKYSLALVVIAALMLLARRRRSRPDQFNRFLDPKPTKDTVILHQYGKASTVPSISPFVMKLETYLRVAKITYINKFSRRPGPKGKLPWIQYNNIAVPDTQFCIQFLNKEKKVDLNKSLKPDQIAIGHLVRRTAEESLYWTIVMWRLIFERTGLVYRKLGLPSFIIWFMRRKAKSGLLSHGIGRHSQQEVTQIMEDDLSAVSQILGENNFLFGNNISEVTEFDCALFGQLCQLIWQMPGTSLGEKIADKHPNLVGFCERMKAAFWPDWDDRILHPSRENEDKAAANILKEKLTFPKVSTVGTKKEANNRVVDASSVTHKSFTAKTLSYGKDRIVKALNGDFTNSVIKSHQVQSGYSENHSVTSRSRSVSASSILADKATILSSQ